MLVSRSGQWLREYIHISKFNKLHIKIVHFVVCISITIKTKRKWNIRMVNKETGINGFISKQHQLFKTGTIIIL